LANIEFGKSEINMGEERKRLPPMVWQNQSVDPVVIFSGGNFLHAVDSKVQATTDTNTQTIGTMETRCTYWKDESMAMTYIPPPQPA